MTKPMNSLDLQSLPKSHIEEYTLCGESFADDTPDNPLSLHFLKIPKGTFSVHIINNSSYAIEFTPVFTEMGFPLRIHLVPQTAFTEGVKTKDPLETDVLLGIMRCFYDEFPTSARHGKIDVSLMVQEIKV